MKYVLKEKKKIANFDRCVRILIKVCLVNGWDCPGLKNADFSIILFTFIAKNTSAVAAVFTTTAESHERLLFVYVGGAERCKNKIT